MNGKALGGHMRSHLFPLPLPRKHIDPHVVLVQDRESETESRNPTRKRSTRARKLKVVELQNTAFKKPSSAESVPELEVVSSVCDDTASDIHDCFEDEEDVASCLMMMGRDKWRVKSVSVARYECETCKKVFGSFQALGGHRTSHKKVKKRLGDYHHQVEEKSLEEKPRKKIIGNNKNVVKKLMHECPVCFKVFGSGQALGGHKRSHFLASSSTSATSTTSSTKQQPLEQNGKIIENDHFGFSFIDLNLPAPMEYEDSSPLEALHLV
ncbi:hypothetical protein AgCh_021321 [Apium graveolens]